MDREVNSQIQVVYAIEDQRLALTQASSLGYDRITGQEIQRGGMMLLADFSQMAVTGKYLGAVQFGSRPHDGAVFRKADGGGPKSNGGGTHTTPRLTMARLRGQGCSAKLQSAFIPACRFGIGESSQSKHGWGLPVIAEDCDSPSALLVFPATGWCMSNYPFLRGTCPSSQREFAGRCSPSATIKLRTHEMTAAAAIFL
jgi:hypothetical protein